MKSLRALMTAGLTAGVLFLAGAPRASATYYFTTYNYSVCLHFSQIAWGKPVAAVYAHIGALQEHTEMQSGGGERTYAWTWDDVQHIKMVASGDHFEGEAYVEGITGGGAGAQRDISRGPIVQYWVYFEDGTSLVTDSFKIEVRNSPVTAISETFAVLSQTTPYAGFPYPVPGVSCRLTP